MVTVDDYVKRFLELVPQNSNTSVLVPPYLLNQFLRVLEIMNIPCTVDLILPDEEAALLSGFDGIENRVQYRVRKREPYLTLDTNKLRCTDCLNQGSKYCEDCTTKKSEKYPSNHRIRP